MNKIKLHFTDKLPDKEGYYWWTNFGEHTPVVLRITKENGRFYAQNEEFCFQIKKSKKELWCYIPIAGRALVEAGRLLYLFIYFMATN